MEMRSDHGYNAARSLRGTHLVVSGNTYANRDWIKEQGGTWNKDAKQWRIPIPGSNKSCDQLLYGIVARGMQWAVPRDQGGQA